MRQHLPDAIALVGVGVILWVARRYRDRSGTFRDNDWQ